MATLPSSRYQALAQWWQLRSRGERTLLALGAAVVGLMLTWLLAWQPVVLDTDRLTRQLDLNQATLATARLQADEIAGLARTAPGPIGSDPRAALDSILVQQGLKNAATTIERIDGERIRLTFEGIAFDAFTAFLDALQRGVQLRAVELVVTARVEPGQVRADVTLSR